MSDNIQAITVEYIDNELIEVELTSIDVVNNTLQFTESLEEYLKVNEVPIKLTASLFQTVNNYIAGSIMVFYNGIKHKAITASSDNTFSFDFDTIVGDIIEVNYIKQP